VKKKVMSKAKIAQVKIQLRQLARQIAQIGPLMRGTIVTNGKKHRQPYFSVNKDRRTHLIYLGERRLKDALKMTENYQKTLAIIEKMTMCNMALLKNDAL
jgi:hypothetical protein